jgi:hypothetical protein
LAQCFPLLALFEAALVALIYDSKGRQNILFSESKAFWYLWLTIQNTANRHVSKAFDLIAVFIWFPLACAAAAAAAADFCCCAPTPTRPPFWGERGTKKKSPVASALALGHVYVGVVEVVVAFCFVGGICELDGS